MRLWTCILLAALGCSATPDLIPRSDEVACLAPTERFKDQAPDGWQAAFHDGNELWREAGVPELEIRPNCPYSLDTRTLDPGLFAVAGSRFIAGYRVEGRITFGPAAMRSAVSEASCGRYRMANIVGHELGHYYGLRFRTSRPDDPKHSQNGLVRPAVWRGCELRRPEEFELEVMRDTLETRARQRQLGL